MNIIRKIARTRKAEGTILAPRARAHTISDDPFCVDITLEANGRVAIPVPSGDTVSVYVLEGALSTGADEKELYAPGAVILFEPEGDAIALRAPASGARLLLIHS